MEAARLGNAGTGAVVAVSFATSVTGDAVALIIPVVLLQAIGTVGGAHGLIQNIIKLILFCAGKGAARFADFGWQSGVIDTLMTVVMGGADNIAGLEVPAKGFGVQPALIIIGPGCWAGVAALYNNAEMLCAGTAKWGSAPHGNAKITTRANHFTTGSGFSECATK